MISLQQCRQILDEHTMSDEELLELRNELYVLAEQSIDYFLSDEDLIQ